MLEADTAARSDGDDRSPLVLLMCGASHMGKSYTAKQILAEFGSVVGKVDDLYTVAVREAGMVAPPDGDVEGSPRARLGKDARRREARKREKDARRRARDRQWADETSKKLFFASLERQFRDLMAATSAANRVVVLEGGSLRREDELSLILNCAAQVFGRSACIRRATVEAPYEIWLRNRVHRMLLANMETVRLTILSREAYESEVKAARPKPTKLIEDFTLGSPEEVRRLFASPS